MSALAIQHLQPRKGLQPLGPAFLADMFGTLLKESLRATVTRKMGYLLSRSAFQDFKKRIDYSEYGGAPLLGVRGVCLICHGRSNGNAIKNAIRVAAEFAEGGINEKIEAELAQFATVQL